MEIMLLANNNKQRKVTTIVVVKTKWRHRDTADSLLNILGDRYFNLKGDARGRFAGIRYNNH